MEPQYSITIVKRTPKTEDEINRNNMMYHGDIHPLHSVQSSDHNEVGALQTVLTESEFLKVRAEILKHWDTKGEK